MKKIILAIAAILGCYSLFAENSLSLINSYNPAVKDGANVWIDVDVLYWKPWERGLVLTTQTSNVFTTDDFTQGSVVHPHFDWSWGYRLNCGYLFSSYNWDVEASWTHFKSHVSQNRSTDGNVFLGMFPIWSLSDDVIPGDYVFESNLKWKLVVNILDLQFGRYLNACHWLDFKPYFGVRSAWVRQHGDVTYKGGIFLIGIIQPGISLNGTDYIQMKNNYWGMGPRVGIAPRLILGKGFSLNMDAAISGLYGFFHTQQNETYLDTTRFSNKEHINRFCWVGDLLAGIQWKSLFGNERYGITFKADWEYHIFFHQFVLKKDNFDLVPNNRDLSVQGVTFSARFDF